MPSTRLATPGAVLFLVGVVLMWWGAGIFRDDSGSIVGGVSKRVLPSPTNLKQPQPAPTSRGGAGGAKLT